MKKLFRKSISIKPTKYKPETLDFDLKLLAYDSAWRGLENVIKDLMTRYNIGNERCLEFGVEFGYSCAAFSNYFKEVTGVDIFTGDVHAGIYKNHFEETSARLKDFTNVKLIESDYKDYIKKDDSQYDLIHVDIIHDYKHTLECGLWSAQHSKMTIFHDTESFWDVRRAVADVAKQTGKQFYNYDRFFGLGIVV